MAELGGSAAHAFRRAIGVFCPQPDDEVLRCAPRGQPQLASSILELACVQDVLAEDPERPFLGIIYAKASALAKLCVPALGEPGGDLLATALLRHFLNPAQRCWREDPLVYLTGALGDRTLPADLVAARLCVLGGLDSVDMVILVRAPRLELTAHISQIRPRRMCGLRAGARLRLKCGVTVQMRRHRAQAARRQHRGVARQRRLGRIGLRHHQPPPRPTRRQRHGQHAAHRT